jgi:hypothetical protein
MRMYVTARSKIELISEQASFLAFREAVLAGWAIYECGSCSMPKQLEAVQPPLFKCIDRYTRVGVLELLLPPNEVSLVQHLAGFSEDVVALGLECQLAALERSSHKPEAVAFSRVGLDRLLTLYDDRKPVERARLVCPAITVPGSRRTGHFWPR